MRFVNNWLYSLTGEFIAAQATLPLPAGAISRLALVEGAEYLLTLSATSNPGTPGETEIIRLTGHAGGYSIARGQEGTQETAWPAGTLIWCAITAGAMTDIFAQLAALTARVAALESGGGGDLPANVLIDSDGRALTDDQGNHLTFGA
ncbi:hypothetical protein [Stutzerimonas stutzeri]|uniref:hypothetical protein n=1 Tax=Stutzerimonas stutzeri TaxID=316 RepID=UPI002658040C|nr:hypothetical protein [Stutzerimonas stutzeri]MCF6780933.1 hypothetical protein [Stutzerimonas stutzeri]MCF6803502.1 hypothetical protein [Stutzerimonas stutzeri]